MATNSNFFFFFRRCLLPPIFEGANFFSNFGIRGAQPVCREPVRLASLCFRPSFLIVLQDETVEPYLQRHAYTFEVEERVKPGATTSRPLGKSGAILAPKTQNSWGLLPQNSNLTLGAFAPNFWGCYFLHSLFEFWARENCPRSDQ